MRSENGMRFRSRRDDRVASLGCICCADERNGRRDELFLFDVAALTVAGALAAMLLKNLVHCALALTVAFAGLALCFCSLMRSLRDSRRFWFTSAQSRFWWCLRFC